MSQCAFISALSLVCYPNVFTCSVLTLFSDPPSLSSPTCSWTAILICGLTLIHTCVLPRTTSDRNVPISSLLNLIAQCMHSLFPVGVTAVKVNVMLLLIGMRVCCTRFCVLLHTGTFCLPLSYWIRVFNVCFWVCFLSYSLSVFGHLSNLPAGCWLWCSGGQWWTVVDSGV